MLKEADLYLYAPFRQVHESVSIESLKDKLEQFMASFKAKMQSMVLYRVFFIYFSSAIVPTCSLPVLSIRCPLVVDLTASSRLPCNSKGGDLCKL